MSADCPLCEEALTHAAGGMSMGKGAVIAAAGIGAVAGRSLLGRLVSSPVVLFAAGVAVGYYGFKYRKEIAAAVAKGSDMGRDMVLNAKESLADLVEETRAGEAAPKE
ncbi:hypothetical protein [Magnetospirillum sp. UT-4]|uniref:hypothetical protein n=1 Tax=Magnetospirillum sp. UT-4 TaxID=2681467 RepID=UPI00137DF93F|nr:hypothetical protein [Magnetospirillum sp. UT-4]CAA7622786.1 conserved hypothetical protein [Magnetospirillum sp. UT-4]